MSHPPKRTSSGLENPNPFLLIPVFDMERRCNGDVLWASTYRELFEGTDDNYGFTYRKIAKLLEQAHEFHAEGIGRLVGVPAGNAIYTESFVRFLRSRAELMIFGAIPESLVRYRQRIESGFTLRQAARYLVPASRFHIKYLLRQFSLVPPDPSERDFVLLLQSAYLGEAALHDPMSLEELGSYIPRKTTRSGPLSRAWVSMIMQQAHENFPDLRFDKEQGSLSISDLQKSTEIERHEGKGRRASTVAAIALDEPQISKSTIYNRRVEMAEAHLLSSGSIAEEALTRYKTWRRSGIRKLGPGKRTEYREFMMQVRVAETELGIARPMVKSEITKERLAYLWFVMGWDDRRIGQAIGASASYICARRTAMGVVGRRSKVAAADVRRLGKALDGEELSGELQRLYKEAQEVNLRAFEILTGTKPQDHLEQDIQNLIGASPREHTFTSQPGA